MDPEAGFPGIDPRKVFRESCDYSFPGIPSSNPNRDIDPCVNTSHDSISVEVFFLVDRIS